MLGFVEMRAGTASVARFRIELLREVERMEMREESAADCESGEAAIRSGNRRKMSLSICRSSEAIWGSGEGDVYLSVGG